MKTVEFDTEIDRDQVIRPPEGVVLPRGKVAVSVRLREGEQVPSEDALASTRAWLLELCADAEQAAPELPKDLAEHHDHYAHGKPLP